MKDKPNITTKEEIREYKKETDAKAKFAVKVSLSKIKGKDLIPDKQHKVLQDRILKRRLKEKEMDKLLKSSKK